MIPRIRGKVGIMDYPKDLVGKFAFEISMWTFDGETRIGEPFGPFGPFDTEQQAQDELRKAVRFVCETLEKDAGLEPSGNFLDMKNGKLS